MSVPPPVYVCIMPFSVVMPVMAVKSLLYPPSRVTVIFLLIVRFSENLRACACMMSPSAAALYAACMVVKY